MEEFPKKDSEKLKNNEAFKVLELIGTVAMPAIAEFVAKEKFANDATLNYQFDDEFPDTFTENFLLGSGKIEEPVPEHVLQYHLLLNGSKHITVDILRALGMELDVVGRGWMNMSVTVINEANVVTRVSDIFHLMSKQNRGEKGVLTMTGDSNFFFIKNREGVLRKVGVSWMGGWHLSAVQINSLNNLDSFSGGHRVFTGSS